MNRILVMACALALAACSESDRTYLLTYDQPRKVVPVEGKAVATPPATSVGEPAEASVAPPPASTEPVAVATEIPPAAAPPPTATENLAPSAAAAPPPPDTTTSARSPTVQNETATVPAAAEAKLATPFQPVQPTPKPEPAASAPIHEKVATAPSIATPPAVEDAPPPSSLVGVSSASGKAEAAGSSGVQASAAISDAPVAVTPPPPPRVVYLKPPPPAPVAPTATVALKTRHAIPALVRPAPPPPETAVASPPASTVAVAAPVAAATAGIAATAAAPAVAGYSAEDAAHCKRVADQRALDARSNSYDEDMQKQIFDGTYQNCMTWAAQHR